MYGASFDTIARLADAFGIERVALFSADAQFRKSKTGVRHRIYEMMALRQEESLQWVEGLLRAALRPRRQKAPLDKSRIKQRYRK